MGSKVIAASAGLAMLLAVLALAPDGNARVPAVCDPAVRDQVIAAFQQSPSAVAVVVGPGIGATATTVVMYPRPSRQEPVTLSWAEIMVPQPVLDQQGLFYQLQTSRGSLWVRMSEVEAVARPTTARRAAQTKQKEGYGIRAMGGAACTAR